MKLTTACFLALCIGLFAACKAQQKYDGYNSTDGHYSIGFNVPPAERTEENQYGFGTVKWKIAVDAKGDKLNLGYMVKYADFPASVMTSDSMGKLLEFFMFLQSDLESTLKRSAVDNIYTIQVNGYPGREFIWKDMAGAVAYTRRLYLVKNRAYMLEVKYSLSNDFNNDIQKFLGSFALVNVPLNTNPEDLGTKPEKKWQAKFPAATKVHDIGGYHHLFGNMGVLMEAYETPKDDLERPEVVNVMFAVSYCKLPAAKLKGLTKQQLHDFVISNFTDNIRTHKNGKILMQKEISLNGHWGYEGQGIILDGLAVSHTRYFLVDDYYYTVTVMSKNGSENNKEALAFLNSFQPQ